ncbi:Permease of the drug/metabolite transporter (DMT) superfamily [Alteribacillus persepolensis]|uniref:Permease of the drug/metabolite transporter (DMT) superfamily n=1 Tax=Alteribacillus persepolensis TaxID=568899 RepID=A0A1G8KIJ6_9BACI|nr:EamA family transporter [Alteribacillus persepolensis]SDI43249.1 Permease of the drug/metabolite transporter (DMT) superfamily [Alteribacillus persepolensis]
MIKGHTKNKGLLLVIIGAVFWGVGGTVSQKLFQDYSIHVNWLVTVRLLLAGTLLLAVQCMRKDYFHITSVWKNKKTAVQLIIFGLLGMLAVQYTYMASIHHGNAAVATLLQYLAPVMIIVYLLLRKLTIFTKQDLTTVALALLGTFLLLTNGSISELSVPFISIFWGILSGAALAFYTLYAIPLLKEFDSLVVVGWAMVTGGAALGFIHPPWQADFSHFTAEMYMYLIFVIICGTMFAFWFYIESLQYLSPKKTSLIGNLEPLAAVLTMVIWLNEPFDLFQWLGMACILGMTLLLAFHKKASYENN